MKKMILMAAMFATSVAAMAQHAVGSFTVAPKVGMTVANVTDFDNSDSRIGFIGGVEGEYQATDLFSISGGIFYSMQGYKYDGSTEILGIKANGDVTTKLDYINIPILANVYVVKGLAVKLGIQPAFNVNASVSGSYNVAGHSGKSDDYDIEAKSFDFSIPVGLSYEYSNFVIDARYNWGLTKVFDNADAKNSVFQLTLGYKFAL